MKMVSLLKFLIAIFRDLNDFIVFKACNMALLLPAFLNTFKRAFLCLRDYEYFGVPRVQGGVPGGWPGVQDLLRVPGTLCARLRSCQQGMVVSEFVLEQSLWLPWG